MGARGGTLARGSMWQALPPARACAGCLLVRRRLARHGQTVTAAGRRHAARVWTATGAEGARLVGWEEEEGQPAT
jgi:hypothetical protein